VRISSIMLLTSVRDELINSFSLIVPVDKLNEKLITEFKTLLLKNRGRTELRFLLADPVEKINLPLFSRSVKIQVNNNITKFLDSHPEIDFKVN